MSEVGLDDVDLATLSWLAGSASNAHLLAALHAAGHPQLRNAHGYVFQHLIGGPKTIGALAQALEITQQGASKVVGELVELGYLAREQDGADKRIARVALSAAGHEAVEVSRRLRANLERTLTARVGKDGVAAARQALWALLDVVGAGEDIKRRRAKPPRD